ncbi:hypothetical protein AWB78_03667 [Caballeronia calidae]|uniref:Uncharacterized protein n=1 Tax=Caballeronia calidae TaxID=1777139 RepID=A0A158C9V8_9BURK|nr:hypothetical protein AWB78_03667 [Caballeronia calidae]
MPTGCFVSFTVSMKSLPFAMKSVCLSALFMRTSGPNARLSIFAGMSFGAMPWSTAP